MRTARLVPIYAFMLTRSASDKKPVSLIVSAARVSAFAEQIFAQGLHQKR